LIFAFTVSANARSFLFDCC